jgi:hypothetical protein
MTLALPFNDCIVTVLCHYTGVNQAIHQLALMHQMAHDDQMLHQSLLDQTPLNVSVTSVQRAESLMHIQNTACLIRCLSLSP